MRLNAAGYKFIGPEVARLAERGFSDARISQILSAGGHELTARQIRQVRLRLAIPPGRVRGDERDGYEMATLPPPKLERAKSTLMESFEQARADVAVHMRPLAEQGMSDRQIADALNAAGIPTISGGDWDRKRVNDIRIKCGIASGVAAPAHVAPAYEVPAGHDTHCNTCDGVVNASSSGRAELHQRLTSMVVGGVYLVGRCEGSREQVVVRPIPADGWGMAA